MSRSAADVLTLLGQLLLFLSSHYARVCESFFHLGT
jgi:hypothetical protein